MLLPGLYAIVRLFQPMLHPGLVGRFVGYFQKDVELGDGDLVVSCVPFLNGVLCDAGVVVGVRIVTVMTDFTNSQSHPWLQDERQVVFCGTEVSERQGKEFGGRLEVRRMSGMVVHPRFYEKDLEGVNDVGGEEWDGGKGEKDRFLSICVCFGGYPPGDLVKETVRGFWKRDDVRILVVCGRNKVLKRELDSWLERRKKNAKRRGDENGLVGAEIKVLGSVDDMAYWMRKCDVVVGKPGPGVVSESTVIGRPVVVVAKQVMSQEKPVIEWVKTMGVGIVVQNGVQAGWLSKAQVELMQENLGRMPKNRAVYEVVDAIELMISERQSNSDESITNPLSSIRPDQIIDAQYKQGKQESEKQAEKENLL